MRRTQKTCPTCGNATYPFRAVLVQMCRVSSRPWPLSVSVCAGGKSVQLERGDVLLQRDLVLLDREDVVGALRLDEEARGRGLRVERVSGDNGPGQRQGREEGGQRGDLVRGGRHRRLRHHHGVLVEDRAEEVRRRLAPAMAPPQGLPVDAERRAGPGGDLEEPRPKPGVVGPFLDRLVPRVR